MNNVVKTNDKEITLLVESKGSTVNNRGLGAQSSWKSDRKVIINGKEYYRVATNEFIDPSEVEVFGK